MLRDENLWYIRGTSLLENLRNSAVKEIRDLHKQVLRHNTFYDYAGALPTKVLKEIVDTGKGSTISMKKSLNIVRNDIMALFDGEFPFHFSKEIHIMVYAGFIVPKYSLYVEHFNRAITGLTEFGIIDHFFFKKVPLTTTGTESSSKIKTADSPRPLKFITIASSIIFIAAMHFLALLVFLTEIADPKRNKNRIHEKQWKTHKKVQTRVHVIAHY